MLAITILGSNIHWLIIISGTLFVLLILLIGLIFTLQAFLLLWNAWIMWRHESHTLANMLTLYLGLAILILPFLEIFRMLLRRAGHAAHRAVRRQPIAQQRPGAHLST